MVNKKARGKRAKTRSKLRKRPGRATVNEVLKPFAEGTAIQIDIRPEMHKGMPPAIYQGSYGVVDGKQGTAYLVSVRKGGLENTLVVHGIHLKAQEAKVK